MDRTYDIKDFLEIKSAIDPSFSPGHGKESRKVNADSTGFGLFIVKNIITQYGGTVSAFSEGAGKGSTFTAEFPIG